MPEAVMCLPILSAQRRGQLTAILELRNARPPVLGTQGDFGPEEEELLAAVTNQSAVSLDNVLYNNKMSQAGWSANKAFFLVDGWSVAFSMRNKLALDSVMLKMESTLTQEIERVVLPGVHYMPFTMQNVSEVVRYVLAEENAAEMQAMVRRAHTALAEELTLEKGAERMRDDLVRLWAAQHTCGKMPGH